MEKAAGMVAFFETPNVSSSVFYGEKRSKKCIEKYLITMCQFENVPMYQLVSKEIMCSTRNRLLRFIRNDANLKAIKKDVVSIPNAGVFIS